MISRNHSIRGQTFPIWVFGALTCLCLMGFAANYGNQLYWQIRAQNAADSAAQGALSVQATHWNATIATLQAAAVEEYRMRNILNDINEVLGSTGVGDQCILPGNTTSGLAQSCNVMYANLEKNLVASANRYTDDVKLIENTDEPSSIQDIAAVKQALKNFSASCGTAAGGDCDFDYSIVQLGIRDTVQMESVHSDCCDSEVGNGAILPGNMSDNRFPLQIEIVACAKVPSILPQAANIIPGGTFTAVGRAAATTVMATQEFMQMGAIENPITGVPFQRAEFPESATMFTPADPATNDPLYRIDYGGNMSGTTFGNYGNPENSDNAGAFGLAFDNPTLQVYTGWWTTVAEESYAGLINASSFNCATPS